MECRSKVRQNEKGILLRHATSRDAAKISSVIQASFREYKSRYTAEAFITTTPSADGIRERIKKESVTVASRDREIVGTVSFSERSEEFYIRSMAVIPEARGARIGELMLTHIENLARKRGLKRLVLDTTPFLTSAIRLYERFGFQRCGTNDLSGTPLITMTKNVKSKCSGNSSRHEEPLWGSK